jgi:hypothetical protein
MDASHLVGDFFGVIPSRFEEHRRFQSLLEEKDAEEGAEEGEERADQAWQGVWVRFEKG